jgi:hypothetical protein
MGSVHSSLVMMMAIDALKRRIIRSFDVAISAGGPYPRRMPVSSGNREERRMREEGCRLPRQSPMANSTVSGKSRSRMIGILRSAIFIQMARNALRRYSTEVIVVMTSQTIDHLMCAPSRKFRSVVVKAFTPRYCIFPVTLNALGAETLRPVIYDGRCIKIRPVTGKTFRGSLGETERYVTLLTICGLVYPLKNERCFRMVKFYRERQIFP